MSTTDKGSPAEFSDKRNGKSREPTVVELRVRRGRWGTKERMCEGSAGAEGSS